MKYSVIIRVALFFLTSFAYSGNIPPEGIFSEVSGGQRLSLKANTFTAQFKIRVSVPIGKVIRLPKKDTFVVGLFSEDGKLVEKKTALISSTTAPDTGSYLKFEKGKMVSLITSFDVSANLKGVFEARLMSIAWHEDAEVKIYEPNPKIKTNEVTK